MKVKFYFVSFLFFLLTMLAECQNFLTRQPALQYRPEPPLLVQPATCSTTNCTWSWGPCSKSCGGGTRTASLDQSEGACGHCDMPADVGQCNTIPCLPPMPVPLAFPCSCSEWATWSDCFLRWCNSTTGIRIRRRANSTSCLKAECLAPEIQNCTGACVRGEWSAYSPCSATCGVSIKTRTRSIQPLFCGVICTGNIQNETCTVPSCSCVQRPWGPWEPCSVNNLLQSRRRFMGGPNSCFYNTTTEFRPCSMPITGPAATTPETEPSVTTSSLPKQIPTTPAGNKMSTKTNGLFAFNHTVTSSTVAGNEISTQASGSTLNATVQTNRTAGNETATQPNGGARNAFSRWKYALVLLIASAMLAS
uniref:spondin-1-like isoform X3 n=1 Tax=Ciona intestinalis TaxID=7719 RepID=UPI000EF55B02|nr:spondin-1-like isoform X3 [Ciona intestinalis]|eukprot:XP_026693573.1 spondin-1-like isoform X3 [Ciona intestinalis]